MKNVREKKRAIHALLLLAAALVFLFDINVRLGVAAGLPYIIVVGLAFNFLGFKECVIYSILTSLLIVVGYFVSNGALAEWGVLFNRMFSIVSIWAVVAVTWTALKSGRGIAPHQMETSLDVRSDHDDFEIAPASITDLLDNIEKSGVLSQDVMQDVKVYFHDFTPAAAVRELVSQKRLTKYQANRIFHGATRGLRYDHYVVLDRIGSGGLSEVFRARNDLTGQVVALKTVLPAKQSGQSLKRLKREFDALSALDHENLAVPIEMGESGKEIYMTIELISGIDLFERVKHNGQMPIRLAMQCMWQAATGMQHAHDNGVVHRDLKPSNMLLDQKSKLKILDFGLAKILEDYSDDAILKTQLTVDGLMCGSIDYMSPEQATSLHLADHRSDIFSLGCTLIFLLTEKAPMAGLNSEQKVQQLLTADRPLQVEHRDDIPNALRPLLLRMTERDVEKRYQTMSEVASDLESLGKTLFGK